MQATADLYDAHPDAAEVCDVALAQYGGVASFAGPIATVRCLEDNVLVRQALSEPGEGRVLVVDGGGSMRVALVGEIVAGLACDNGWAGLVLNAAVRDVAALRQLPLGIKALGACPRKSAKTGAGEVDVPVSFGGVTFTPGATLASDDGIVVLDRSG